MNQSINSKWVRRGLSAFVAVELVAGAGMIAVASRDAAPPVSVDDAIADFRDSQSAATTTQPPAASADVTQTVAPEVTQSTDTATPTTTATTNPPTAQPALPTPGVYVYRTDGYEEVDALTGARHDYPQQTTISYTQSECGVLEKWAPLQERSDERVICPGANGDEVRWFDSKHEFFGQKDSRRLTCAPGAVVRPLPGSDGQTWTYECRNEQDRSVTNATRHAVDEIMVGDTAVPAIHIELRVHISGSGTAEMTINLWLHPDNGLVLRKTAQVEASSSTPSGTVRYEESYDLRLESLTPRT